MKILKLNFIAIIALVFTLGSCEKESEQELLLDSTNLEQIEATGKAPKCNLKNLRKLNWSLTVFNERGKSITLSKNKLRKPIIRDKFNPDFLQISIKVPTPSFFRNGVKKFQFRTSERIQANGVTLKTGYAVRGRFSNSFPKKSPRNKKVNITHRVPNKDSKKLKEIFLIVECKKKR